MDAKSNGMPTWLKYLLWFLAFATGLVIVIVILSLILSALRGGKRDKGSWKAESKKTRAEAVAAVKEAKADKIEHKTAVKDAKAIKQIARGEFRACKKACRRVPRRKGQRRACKRQCAETFRSQLSKIGLKLDASDQQELADANTDE